jgi:hypothetical protein
MLTNFDLIWLRVRQLMDSLLEAEGDNIDEANFNTYCSSFEQLMQIIEAEPDTISEEQLEIVQFYLNSLEAKFSEVQKAIQKKISEERLKAVTFSKYSLINEKENIINKKT